MTFSINSLLKNRVIHMHLIHYFIVTVIMTCIVGFIITMVFLNQQVNKHSTNEEILKKKLTATQKDLTALKNEDQYVKNKKLEVDIHTIETTYKKAVTSYEKLLDLKDISNKTDDFDKTFASALTLLSQRNYASAEATLNTLNKQIDDEKAKIAQTFTIPKNVTQSNSPPSAGYSQQTVNADVGTFLVSIISADLASTRVIVDTASDSDCKDNCPVLPLADYVSRNGAYAGINGSYFCPSAYPSCAGKTNSFDLLVMNKNKHYFNSDNNVYSTNPAVIFMNGSIRFVSQALGWGRDTGVDGILSNFPLLVSGNNVVYSDNPDPKFNSKGPRDFVANKGNTVYIGMISNATMGYAAHVLKALGMDNAMNLDEGGSTALWYRGYKAGPGRNIPNAILFVRK